MCGPNDVWSLGVILVNLTCGRNPWKEASTRDSTYRAYSEDKNFLKSILPLSDDLSDILGRIFEVCPQRRITLPELRNRIMACSRLTVSPPSASAETFPSTGDLPPLMCEYTNAEDAVDDEWERDSLLSSSLTWSDNEGSGSCGKKEDELIYDLARNQPINEPHDLFNGVAAENYFLCGKELLNARLDPGPLTTADASQTLPPNHLMMTVPVQAPCQSRHFFPLWEAVKCAEHVPMLPHAAFHDHVSLLAPYQGCY